MDIFVEGPTRGQDFLSPRRRLCFSFCLFLCKLGAVIVDRNPWVYEWSYSL